MLGGRSRRARTHQSDKSLAEIENNLTQSSTWVRQTAKWCLRTDNSFCAGSDISNVHSSDEFRHKSFLSDKAVAVICGLGTFGYKAAIDFIEWKIKATRA